MLSASTALPAGCRRVLARVREGPSGPPSLIGDGWIATSAPRGMEDLVISGIDLDDQQARITVLDVPDRPGQAARIFRNIADANVYVDMIVQNVSLEGSPNLSFTVQRRNVSRAKEAVTAIVGPDGLLLEPEIAKVSVRGVGMRTHTRGRGAGPWSSGQARHCAGRWSGPSEVSINVAVDRASGQRARQCLAQAFLQPDPARREQ